MAEQLEIDGIGQQKAKLSDWKKANDIFTHHSPHMDKADLQWTCWSEDNDPGDFLGKHGDDAFGFGSSEKAAIADFCHKHNIERPFWW
ncbi:hypothetical protein [Methylophaga sp.]|uniref:hypothetical protein n=1 Tax=Methylophaga sp. TaxID=2024840 RepID=UPI003A92158F